MKSKPKVLEYGTDFSFNVVFGTEFIVDSAPTKVAGKPCKKGLGFNVKVAEEVIFCTP